MIDIKLIRESPEEVRKSIKKRGLDNKEIEQFIFLDNEWRKIKKEADDLRSKRNNISERINAAKKAKNEKMANELIKEAQEIPGKIEAKNKNLNELDKERLEIWKNIPNILDKSVPVGSAKKNRVLKKYGKIRNKKLDKGHAEIMEEMDLINTKKAAEVAGSRFYYLKNDLVKLNYAIINFALDFLRKKKFQLIQPPYMLNRRVLEGAVTLDTFEDAIYKIENEDLYLIGTAEHALNALYFNEVINKSELPIQLAGVSPSFRKEAGAHGKDTKGIFRVHQFEKIEQFVFCKPKDSWKEFDLILKNTIDMFKALEIPFRTVVLASGDTGKIPTKTIDVEGWFPSQGAYRELGSCSNCLDYQARRSNIRFQESGETKFVYTLNNTAIATERMITCLVENDMQKDGSIKIPKALWRYTGFKLIKAKK